MRKRWSGSLFLAVLLVFAGCLMSHGAGDNEAQEIKAAVNHILKSNAEFVKKHGPSYFKPFTEDQHPKVTVVSCSDSRVHMHALDATPDNELFVIRNIGNQIATAEGSVEYGVHHLHTPVLLIVGHVRCGAIKAASGDYSLESAPIKKELDTIKIPKGGESLESVKLNVNNQVDVAMKKFDHEIQSGELVVIGSVYDFANDLKNGQGKLTIINVNGDADAGKIKAFASGGGKSK
jgi:carbonic anhydrase